MIPWLFKLFSFALLGMATSFYFAGRDLPFSKKTTYHVKEIATTTTLQETPELILVGSSSPTIENHEKESVPEKDVKVVTPAKVTITEKPKEAISKSVYEKIEQSNSDTDESYAPQISPCVSPLTYRVGRVDKEFSLSKEAFKAKLVDATSLWSLAAGKNLFAYNEAGLVTVNLIYDERQANTVNLEYLGLEIENTKQNAENIRIAYESEKALYTEDGAKFNKNAADFQERYAKYNEKVAEYNQKGGAGKIEYDAMMNELDGLKKESAQLELTRQDLLKREEELNGRVKRYNELVTYANTLIKRNNSLSSREFIEGVFVSNTHTINIYQFANETKFKRVLVHEFGHALGIMHNENKDSIMNAMNLSSVTTLSTEDIRDLMEVCSH